MAEAGAKTTIDFDGPDWTPIDQAFGRFKAVARGDPTLAVRDLQRALENDHLESGYVRMPVQHRQPDGTLLWIPEREERGLLSYQFWRSEARVQEFPSGLRCVPRSNKVVSGRYLFFVRCANLDAFLAPAGSADAAAPATPDPALNKQAHARRLILEIYGRAPHTIPKQEAKTGTVRTRVNTELKNRDKNAERFSWDTINRALGRDRRRKN